MMYFLIYSGFNDPNPISIDQTELEKAVGAQMLGNKATVVLKHGSINGGYISKIAPDFERIERTDYQDKLSYYDPNKGRVVKREVKEAHFLSIENAGEIVKAKMENRPPQLKETTTRIHTKGLQAIGEMLG